MIDFDRLKAHRFPHVLQSYTTRDTLLYALGLNIGADPADPDALRYVADDPPVAVPTMAMTLARPGPWMREPGVGIDYGRVVVGEVALRLLAPIPPAATVRGEHRIERVTDKGPGRGALVTVLRRLSDAATGAPLAEFRQVTFCRGDGGFATDGRHDPAAPPFEWAVGDRAPDRTDALPTDPRQALIYRLSGDMNPLHAYPEVARKAGFDRPILHGLSTMGMAGHALSGIAASEGARLRAMRGRLSGPVVPGEVLRLETWREETGVLFRVLNDSGKEVVSLGSAKFQ